MAHIGVLGNGGHARTVAAAYQAWLTTWEPAKAAWFMGALYFENDDGVPVNIELLNGIGNKATKDGPGLTRRREIFEKFGRERFPNIRMHPDLKERGIQRLHDVYIGPGCTVGDNVILNTRATVEHDCIIGAHCHVAPGAVLCGNVVVGEETHIGAGAIVKQGVKIGSRCVIGMGAVVLRDVPDGAVIVGNPARRIDPPWQRHGIELEVAARVAGVRGPIGGR